MANRRLFKMRNRDWALIGVGGALAYVAYRQWKTECFLGDVMRAAREMVPVPHAGSVVAPAPVSRQNTSSEKNRLMDQLRRDEEKRQRGGNAEAEHEPTQTTQQPAPTIYIKGDPRAQTESKGSGSSEQALLRPSSGLAQPKSGGRRGGRSGSTVQFTSQLKAK